MKTAGIIFSTLSGRSAPLLEDRTIAAIPFACRYRLVDFSLSMLVAAGVTDILVVTDGNYRSLADHIGTGKDWDLARRRGGIRLITPFRTVAPGTTPHSFRGPLDALFGMRRDLFPMHHEEFILMRGDVVANVDLRAALLYHRREKHPMTAVLARAGEGRDADLGIRILDRTLLFDLLSSGDRAAGEAVFSAVTGKDSSVFWHEGYASAPTGLIDYFTESIRLTREQDVRRALLCDPHRPILTKVHSTSPAAYRAGDSVHACLLADDCIIDGEVKNSVLFRGVRVEKGARVENSVLFGGTYVGRGSALSCVVADKGVVIGEGRHLSGHTTMPLYIPKERKV
ncbi:MAG: hypothetical protein IJF73_04085 [Clostridia bacterium]|nr:hypothetical protein [Clostridia bacterium]